MPAATASAWSDSADKCRLPAPYIRQASEIRWRVGLKPALRSMVMISPEEKGAIRPVAIIEKQEYPSRRKIAVLRQTRNLARGSAIVVPSVQFVAGL
jgi:hypothetical protein